MKRRICKNCKMFVNGDACENCGSNQFSTSFQGRITILSREKSEIAKKIGIEKDGEYAIKVR